MNEAQLKYLAEAIAVLNTLDQATQTDQNAHTVPYLGDIPVYLDGEVIGTLDSECGEWVFMMKEAS